MTPSLVGRRSCILVLLTVAIALASAEGVAAQQPGSVRGRVTELEGGAPVASAQIFVLGTRLGTLSGPTGEYALRGVPAGAQAIRVVRLGFAPVTQQVTVAAGGDNVVDFQLAKVAATLEEVVTTATGEQSRRSFGNVVATVRADSIAERAPITNVHELLQARTASVQVIQGWGQTGSSSSIRIRGTSSLSLTNEPLVIIDGIRFDNSPHSSNFTSARVNRLNSLNPEEIETIEIIKGPSAAALYGTAAANGVIVVKTKRGQVGKPRWNAYVEGGVVEQPAEWEGNYWSWGQNLNASGQRIGGPVQCKTFQAAARQCVVDSLTTYNPWVAPETAPFADQARYMYGLQVSGGSENLQYFLAAEREDETGPYQMPSSEVARITNERGGIGPRPRELNPNQLIQNAFRANFRAGVRPNLTVDVSTGYTHRDLYTAFEGTFFAGMTFQYITAPGFKTSTNGTQREFVGDIFGVENRLRDNRFTGSMAVNWQPLTWLAVRGVTGLDQTNSYGYRQQLRGEGPRVGVSWGPTAQEGGKDFDRSNNSRYTVDLGATATWAPRSDLSTRTSIGGQWFMDALYQGQGRGYGLPPGASTPNSARLRESWEFTTQERTYGAFIEEQVAWRERVYVTLGARTDQNSAFGVSVGNTTYPRAAVSYVVSEEGWFPRTPWLGRLRLRAAWGKAGVQPSTIAALQFLGAASYPAGAAADEPGLRLASIGNDRLKPEVTTETEAGFDLGMFDDRVVVEATVFNKESKDALFQRPLPPSYGTAIGSASPTQWQNLARVQNRGVELTVDAQIVRTDPVSWSLRVNGSHLRNKLVDAGGVPLPTTPGARNEVSYPLFGLWDRPILSYSDADGNGIISDSEIVVGPAIAYRGPTLPTVEAGLSNTIGFFKDQVQISALFDYRGKFLKHWRTEEWRCQSSSNCRAVNDSGASLEDQATATAANSSTKRTTWGYFVRNDFIKFRELSLSYTLPADLAGRFLRGRSAMIVVSGRNLGYPWTKYPGTDPESNDLVGNTGGGNRELTAQPPIRYWIARVNVGF